IMSSDAGADRADLNRNLIVFAWTAPTAVVIFLIFHAVYSNIIETAHAVGQIDSSTMTGLAMGWVAMVGGTGVFAVIALVAGIRALRAWSRLRHSA
ncbi:MAG TPA: hypothetical protein VK760_05470, partial [Candidatus Acidoferrales bacterium]|nr:hypothetical protein [Candidatus Acidoferrales bacterium]